jgi:hypothetical protein
MAAARVRGGTAARLPGGTAARFREATFTCAGDTVLGGKEKLAYGTSLRAGDFTCGSATKAMR